MPPIACCVNPLVDGSRGAHTVWWHVLVSPDTLGSEGRSLQIAQAIIC